MVSIPGDGLADNGIPLTDERERLVRLCARLTGNASVAEDLAQETLLEAWRHEHTLRDPGRRAQWLSGIARNVCLRWIRRRGRDLPQLSSSSLSCDLDNQLADDLDLEVELERDELADLLDRALAQLPAETRQALIYRYVDDLPQSEVAERLRLSPGALAMRVQRGKLTLRRILTTDLRDEAASYGLILPNGQEYQPTRVLCQFCSGARLQALVDHRTGLFKTRCLSCGSCITEEHDRTRILPVGFKRALRRVADDANAYYQHALRSGSARCARCLHATPLRTGLPPEIPEGMKEFQGVHLRCENCGALSYQSVAGLASTLPEVQCFWRRHRRIQMLWQERPLPSGELLTSFDNVLGSARIDVVMARETLLVVRVVGAPDDGD